MSKEKVSNDYIAQQKALHEHKRLSPLAQSVTAITGYSGVPNIAAAIGNALRAAGGAVEYMSGDVRTITPDFRHYDRLVLSHGVTWLDWLEDCPPEKIREIIDVNLMATIRLVQLFVRTTIDSAVRKQVIVIGSMAHRAVLNASAAYCASKAGVAHFVRCAAWELAPKGYDVFCINPSNTEGTPMTEDTIQGIQRYRGVDREAAEAYWAAVRPLPRWLNAGDIGALITFIATGSGQFLSGSQIDLSGAQR